MLPNFKIPKQGGRTMAALALAFSAFASVSNIKTGEFGLRETFYRWSSGIIEPSVSLQVPLVQFTHHYGANTQKIEFNAGSCRFVPFCGSTSDKNILTAEIALNYRVLPDANKLALHRWEMDGFVMQDGYWLLTKHLNHSANVVMGRYTMAQTLSNPDRFMKELHEDFANRIKTNNIPVEIESLELKELNTSFLGSRTIHSTIIRNPNLNVTPTPQ